MAIVDHTSAISVPYSANDTYASLKKVIPYLDGFSIERCDDILKTVYLKAGVSLFSWGENITVTISENQDNSSSISILSTPKTGVMFGGAMDMGKNRKNIDTIMSVLSNELKSYSQITISESPTYDNSLDDIRKLKSLLDDGIITREEFEAKKKQLLGI